ncbi:MAG: pantoate--beta-alanine ligase [Chloroflexi bacterium]|nr:pantoate--beta-alanine ligase [Chloroflexi bacterium CFX1]MCK6569282.1 pantoate--beta-alanine ligase [Anaerolineales bacterium]MCQ3954142.1 pantoate--beta-alanine ligase [Chloroflexota bacterium]MDL1920805.1 pantoate--beta-alanine ligase [Chloroflexi bacterium CFX5]NUQ60070.1 pantoate--beta-alanine ligase [Anaerolineales bacterium]
MQISSLIPETKSIRLSFKGTVGLVPTMGYLHEGHLSLVQKAKRECDHVVATIFVNPTQFGANEDLSKYPRDFKRDSDLLESLGVDLLWSPTAEIMYPPGYQTWVEVEALTKGLEGAMRPGHFRGVATVVAKLFNVIQPDKAYFGQKDAQQAAVIRRMVKDLNFPLEVIVCPTVREADGLAMSSRNVYLSAEERAAATVLYRALSAAKDLYEAGERNAEKLRERMKGVLSSEPLAQMQYVSCADYDSLEELDVVIGKTLLSMAVFFGKTRLIDNFVLG